MELKDLIGKAVICEKVDALKYKEGHPNGIDTGYVTGGILVQLEPYVCIDTGYIFDCFCTSKVDHIEENLVYTKNSVYKISELKLNNNENN